MTDALDFRDEFAELLLELEPEYARQLAGELAMLGSIAEKRGRIRAAVLFLARRHPQRFREFQERCR